jgi:hypothetical protein
MLDSSIFIGEFARLCVLFSQPEDKIGAIYYEALKDIDNGIFRQLCQEAIATQEWMPKPVWFLTRASDLMEQEAERSRHAQPALAPAPDRYVAFADLSSSEQERIRQALKIARPNTGMKQAGSGFGRIAQLTEQNLKLRNPATVEAAIEWAHQQSWVEIERDGDRVVNLKAKLQEVG